MQLKIAGSLLATLGRNVFLFGLVDFFLSPFQENRYWKEHGGEEGIDTPSNTTLAYYYNIMSILVPPPCEPIVIQAQSSRPNEFRVANQTGITVIFYELSHPTLWQWAVQGLNQVECFTATNGTSFFDVFSFYCHFSTQCPHLLDYSWCNSPYQFSFHCTM